MDRACRDKKQVILVNRYLLQILHHRTFCQCLLHFFLCAVLPQTVDQFCIPGCIQHIPHLRFSKLTMFLHLCIVIIRMHLHRQILSCIDQLHQDWQRCFALMPFSQILRVGFYDRSQLHFVKRSTTHSTYPIRMRGTFPCFCQRRQLNILPIFIVQPFSTPQVILTCRTEQKGFISFFHAYVH